jgi:hypothetical protein
MAVGSQTLLDAVEQAILDLTTGGAIVSYAISGRQVTKANLTELFNIRDRLRLEVGRAAGGGASGYSQATFGRAR